MYLNFNNSLNAQSVLHALGYTNVIVPQLPIFRFRGRTQDIGGAKPLDIPLSMLLEEHRDKIFFLYDISIEESPDHYVIRYLVLEDNPQWVIEVGDEVVDYNREHVYKVLTIINNPQEEPRAIVTWKQEGRICSGDIPYHDLIKIESIQQN